MERTDVLDDYFYSDTLLDAPYATRRIRRADVQTLCRSWDAISPTPLDPARFTAAQATALIETIAAEPGKGPALIDRIAQSGRHWWAWLIAEGVATENAFAHIAPSRAKGRRAASPRSQLVLDTLLEECTAGESIQRRRLTAVLWLTRAGLRPLEIENCQVEDIDRVQGTIVIRNPRGEARCCCPLAVEAIAAIDAYCVAANVPTTPRTALIGSYRDGRWHWFAAVTLRRHFHALRAEVAAQLRAVEATPHSPLQQQALLRLADTIATVDLDDLRR